MNAENRRTLVKLATELKASGRPYIVGGDWNATPDVLGSSGLMDFFDGGDRDGYWFDMMAQYIAMGGVLGGFIMFSIHVCHHSV